LLPHTLLPLRSTLFPYTTLFRSISVGDTLVVFPHEICPVDGVVEDGTGKMNEAYLTGEPFEIEKMPGSQVISGAINGDVAIHIRDRKSTRLNSSHVSISYAVFCL